MKKKIYFLTSCLPDFNGNGLAKRCAMWHFLLESEGYQVVLKNYYEDTKNRKLILLLKSGKVPNIIINSLNFLTSFLKRKAYIKQAFKSDSEVFIFRINSLLNFTTLEITDLLESNNKVIKIDLDESEYASNISIFGLKYLDNFLKYKVYKIENLLANSKFITKYVASDFEKNNFLRLYGNAENIHIQSNKLLKTNNFIEHKSFKKPFTLLILGDYKYLPNKQMLLYLIQSLASSEIDSKFKFHIVGGGIPTQLFKQLSQFNSVKVHGFLSNGNLTKILNSVDFHYAPIFSGGGTKFKIIEALSYGVPTVSTIKGTEGLNLLPFKHYIPCENFTDLDQLLDLDENSYFSMQKNCFDLFNSSYAL